MALGKQAKTLTKQQIEFILGYLGSRRNGLRDQTIFLLSVRAGLRARVRMHSFPQRHVIHGSENGAVK